MAGGGSSELRNMRIDVERLVEDHALLVLRVAELDDRVGALGLAVAGLQGALRGGDVSPSAAAGDGSPAAVGKGKAGKR